VFHNLSKYDCHIFIKKLRGEFSCFPTNEENYITFNTKRSFHDDGEIAEKEADEEKKWERKLELRFIDSLNFCLLVSTLCKKISEGAMRKSKEILLRRKTD